MIMIKGERLKKTTNLNLILSHITSKYFRDNDSQSNVIIILIK